MTTGAVVAELRQTVLDGRIQRLGLVDAVTIGAEIYAQGRRWHLIASADPQHPRIHLTRSMPSTDPNLITPFGLQLRKYVRGGFLIGIEQPPLERVVRISIAKRMAPLNDAGMTDIIDEDDDEDDIWSGENVSRLDLMVEIMGRHSNLVLVDEDGRVRESAKRVTSSMSRVRPILPKLVYELPPPPNKPDPRQVTSPTMMQFLGAVPAGTKLADALVRGFRGVSPQIGREVAFRTVGDTGVKVDDVPAEASRELAQTIRGMFQPLLTGNWEPHLYEDDGVPVGYGAIPIGYLAALNEDVPLASISEAVEQAEGAAGETTPQDHAQRRARLVQAIDSAIGSVDSRLRSLRQQHERSRDTERLRRWGDAIYAYLWQIRPGDSELIAETEAGTETIPLDPALDAKEQAQAYFEEYRKAQKAGNTLPERIEQAQHERAYLEQLRTQAQQADGFAAIEALRHEFEEQHGDRHPVQERAGHTSRKKQGQKRVAPITDDGGNLIYIGRSGRENEQVTFDIAGPDDWWLHARGVPGSHVILRLRVPAAEPDEVAVETAAALAAWYSGSRESGSVEVDVTQRRHVRKIKGAGPGMVTYRNERTISVHPADEAALRKVGRVE
ncbi:MAG TPA: NFACT RNA binding domain-containing protein [Thermomicrobiales bacterium]|nr:NFACT RNA binding domain-containing protein [Thermomicrobiales bacterium]